MAQSLYRKSQQLRIACCVALVSTVSLGVSQHSLAQIVPDATLGSEPSVIVPNVPIQGVQSDRIDGGAIRGTNLFHSFSQFNVGQGRGAYFTNPVGIDNILSRVTGTNRSEVLGKLGVLGTANLFLINPNGIVFGSNASLDVQGSFVATTANAIQFPNGENFSASVPAAPSVLLTVNPSAFLFNQLPVGAITNSSRTPVGATPVGNQFGLQVADGRSLLLLGGNITIDGGGAIAWGGRIEFSAIAQSGTIGLNMNGNDLSLNLPESVEQAEISLRNGALVSVNGQGGGDIQIQGRRITLSEGSQVTTVTLGAEAGGNLVVRATDAVEVSGTASDSQIVSALSASTVGSGDAGNLSIDTRRLLVQNGAQVSASTRGQGKGGSLSITAADAVELSGTPANGRSVSGLFASTQGSGDAGNLRIDTRHLLVQNGAQVSAATLGSGKGGSLSITATDAVELSGTASDIRFRSGLFTQSQGSGDAGNLRIDTRRLLVRDRARISVSTSGQGKGGSLNITATDAVEVSGASADGRFSSSLFAESEGSGDAADVRIDTRRLLVRDGAFVSVATSGQGKGGSLNITAADAVEVSGTSADSSFPSGLFASAGGSGNAGNLSIDTGRLLVQNGAQVSVSTSGQGKGGSLSITATDAVELSGTSADGQLVSNLSAQSRESGDAGNLNINTRRLLVQNGAQVSVSTSGQGKGGSLNITAADAVELSGTAPDSQIISGLFASSRGSGNAGNLSIDTRRLLVQNGAQVSASTRGQGKGGSLNITAADAVELSGTSADGQINSGLLAQSQGSGDAGNLSIDTGRLLVRDGAQVSVTTFASGKGGSLNITAADTVELSGTASNGFAGGLFAQSQGSGDAGNLSIDTRRLLIRDGAQISSRSSETGTAGNINITARDTLQAERGTIRTDADQTQGGAIAIQAGTIRLFNNSDIRSNVASGTNNSGTISLTADSILAFNDSDILAFARDGRGGDITLNTPAFFGQNYRPASRGTSLDTLDRNDRVDINATGAISGIVTLPDVSFIQNSLTDLPDTQINTDSILANSCIVRRGQPTQGSFTITGTGGLPQRPGEAQTSSFPTVRLEALPGESQSSTLDRAWRKGDPIVEPQGVYRLPNGKVVLSRNCP